MLRPSAPEISTTQIGAAQVQPLRRTSRCLAAAEDRQGSLHVCGPPAQPPVAHDGFVFGGLTGAAGRPRGMTADEGGQHLGDGGPILGGVDGDALQSIDATQPHIQVLVAELVDRSGESLSDLAFTRKSVAAGR
jgi:hypothetical protein